MSKQSRKNKRTFLNKNKKSRKLNKNKKSRKPRRTFKHNTPQLPMVYGKIHMIGCGHCENLIPEWNLLNEKMKRYSNIICYDIERGEEGEKFPIFNHNYKPYENIQIQGGYPTIYKLYKQGGVITYYNGPRDNQSLFYWLQKKV
jgi:hypothetical protein